MWSIGSNATNTRNDITQIRCCHQDEQKKALKYLIVKNILCIKCKKQVINNLSLSRRNYVCLEYLDNMCKCGRVIQVYFWSIWTKFEAVAQLARGQVGVSGQICLQPGGTPCLSN